jgi:peptide/nickel transport system ATP-binding protein
MSLLAVQDLTVSFPTADGLVEAVRGIVGESGSGKSVSIQTIVGLTQGALVTGRALFEGRDLLSMSADELRRVRGAQIGMIFQDPLSSLHPMYRVGWQIVEAIEAHEEVSGKVARRRAVELLGRVGIPRPDRRVDDYPHQFSGGMRQRAMIAMAIALNPRLLIADEPTTALDVTVQAQIIELMKELQREFGTAIIMITHDLGVLSGFADDVMVMYAGRAMEHGARTTVYRRPYHPYTRGLIQAMPRRATAKTRLTPIAGQPPSLIGPPAACPFHPRCPHAFDRCRLETPPLIEVETGHVSACWLSFDESPAVASGGRA